MHEILCFRERRLLFSLDRVGIMAFGRNVNGIFAFLMKKEAVGLISCPAGERMIRK